MKDKSRVVTAATIRARQMMVGGLVGGHVVGAVVIAAAAILGDAGAVLSAVLGFAAVIIFFAIGQWLEVIACELDPVQGLGLAMVSYVVRVIGIGAGLWLILSHPSVAPQVSGGWLLLSVTTTVFSWLAGVILVASRQRVPVYDQEYVPPETKKFRQ